MRRNGGCTVFKVPDHCARGMAIQLSCSRQRLAASLLYCQKKSHLAPPSSSVRWVACNGAYFSPPPAQGGGAEVKMASLFWLPLLRHLPAAPGPAPRAADLQSEPPLSAPPFLRHGSCISPSQTRPGFRLSLKQGRHSSRQASARILHPTSAPALLFLPVPGFRSDDRAVRRSSPSLRPDAAAVIGSTRLQRSCGVRRRSRAVLLRGRRSVPEVELPAKGLSCPVPGTAAGLLGQEQVS